MGSLGSQPLAALPPLMSTTRAPSISKMYVSYCRVDPHGCACTCIRVHTSKQWYVICGYPVTVMYYVSSMAVKGHILECVCQMAGVN